MRGRKRKLSPEIEAALCAWAAQSRSIAGWARKLGVSTSTVQNAIARGLGQPSNYKRRLISKVAGVSGRE